MKKLLTIAVAALMLASCNAKADKATSNALNDSVSEAMGKLYGSGISSSFVKNSHAHGIASFLK